MPHLDWLAEMMRFASANFASEGGEQLCFAGMGCRQEIGGYSISDTRSTEAMRTDAAFREALMQSLLGTLVARIDTGDVSGRVTINGSIGRHVPTDLPSPNGITDTDPPSVQTVYGAILNTELHINAAIEVKYRRSVTWRCEPSNLGEDWLRI